MRLYSKKSFPGNYYIHYDMLTHLCTSATGFLLKIFNIIWQTGVFTTQWSEAIILPFNKKKKINHLTTQVATDP